MEKLCVVLIAENNDKVLAVSRKNDFTNMGLPGGKVDNGESPEIGLKRELMEETGLSLIKLEYLFTVKDNQCKVMVYRGDVSGNIRVTEPVKVEWVDWKELFKAKTFGLLNRAIYRRRKPELFPVI